MMVQDELISRYESEFFAQQLIVRDHLAQGTDTHKMKVQWPVEYAFKFDLMAGSEEPVGSPWGSGAGATEPLLRRSSAGGEIIL